MQIEHQNTKHGGVFYIERDQARIAEITYHNVKEDSTRQSGWR